MLHQPEIPQNTGNISRTCVAIGAKLWLVKPLGFDLSEKQLRRAGLDYWQHLQWEVVDRWEDLLPERSRLSSLVLLEVGDADLHRRVATNRVMRWCSAPRPAGLPPSLLDESRHARCASRLGRTCAA